MGIHMGDSVWWFMLLVVNLDEILLFQYALVDEFILTNFRESYCLDLCVL